MAERTFELIIKATKRPTRLIELDVDIAIYGFIAKTTATMTFKNETDNDTEGELIFPLPDGAAMCGYAVDINGALVDGVVVEKEQARIAFESEARKTVEKPQVSLAENVVGNVFKTRIFPLPKQGTRKIRVSYVEQLDVQHGVSAQYDLPLYFNHAIESYSLRVMVEVTDAGSPTMDSDFETGEPIPRGSLDSDEAYYGQKRYIISYKNVQNQYVKKGVRVVIPNFAQTVILDNDEDGQWYFAVSHPPIEKTVNQAAPVSCIGIFWDASKSRKQANRDLEIRFLRELLRKLNNVKIELVVFRDAPEAPRCFICANGVCDALFSYLNSVSYDGGTNIGALDARKGTEDNTATISYWLLFTDGIHNLGISNTPHRMAAPIYPLSSSEQANHTLLRIIARKSGGEYHKLTNTTNLYDLSSKIGADSFAFIGAEYDEKLISEVYPSIPTPVNGFTFKFAGKLMMPSFSVAVPLSIMFNYGIGTKVIRQYRCEIKLPRASMGKFPSSRDRLAVRFWAQRKIDELQQFPDIPENKELITKMGRKYNIVTDNTSFIVLESLDAYLKYEIEPPASLPEIYSEYKRIMEERALMKHKKNEETIHDVLDFWRRRVAWYNEDQTSPEAGETYFIHCYKYGDGVDKIYHAQASEWMQYRHELEREQMQKREAELRWFVRRSELAMSELESLLNAFNDSGLNPEAHARLSAEAIELYQQRKFINSEVSLNNFLDKVGSIAGEVRAILFTKEAEIEKKGSSPSAPPNKLFATAPSAQLSQNQLFGSAPSAQRSQNQLFGAPPPAQRSQIQLFASPPPAPPSQNQRFGAPPPARPSQIQFVAAPPPALPSQIQLFSAPPAASPSVSQIIHFLGAPPPPPPPASAPQLSTPPVDAFGFAASSLGSAELTLASGPPEPLPAPAPPSAPAPAGFSSATLDMRHEVASFSASLLPKRSLCLSSARKKELRNVEEVKGRKPVVYKKKRKEPVIEKEVEQRKPVAYKKNRKEPVIEKEVEEEKSNNVAMIAGLWDAPADDGIALDQRLDINYEPICEVAADAYTLDDIATEMCVDDSSGVDDEDEGSDGDEDMDDLKEEEDDYDASMMFLEIESEPVELRKQEVKFAKLPSTPVFETITIKTENVEHKVTVDLSGTVGSLKGEIESALLVPRRFQVLRLIERSTLESVDSSTLVPLEPDSAPLSQYNINHRTVLQLNLNTTTATASEADKKIVSWAEWRLRQHSTWRDFETDRKESDSHVFMKKWNEARHAILQARIQKRMEEIELEFRRTPALRDGTISLGDKKTARGNVVPLPLPEPSATYVPQLSAGVNAGAIYNTYLRIRDAPDSHYSKLSSFYFDVANALFTYDKHLAIRTLSSLAELEYDDPQPLRVMAYRLEMEVAEYNDSVLDLTISVFRRISEMRPEEPQSHRDLAAILMRKALLQLEQSKRNDTTVIEEQSLRADARKCLVEAINLLTKTVMGKWDVRFDQVQLTALMDLNRLLAFARFYDMADLENMVDKRLITPIELDLRIVVRWDTDLTNIELHVTEPSGEVCSPWKNRTKIGGMMSKDMSKGYGPVEYLLKSAPTGEFRAAAKLYATLERPSGTTVSVSIFTDFGRPGTEKERIFVFRLQKEKEIAQFCSIKF